MYNSNPRSRPLHQHDCRGCAFLGSRDGKDFYQCDHIDFCIRWGDEDSENKSMVIDLVERNPEFYKGDWQTCLELYLEKYGHRAGAL